MSKYKNANLLYVGLRLMDFCAIIFYTHVFEMS